MFIRPRTFLILVGGRMGIDHKARSVQKSPRVLFLVVVVQRWADNSVFEYYSNTCGRILVFVFVFRWLFETEYYSYSYSGNFLKPNIIRIRIRAIFSNRILFVFVFGQFSQTEYHLYLYSDDFLKPNTGGNFFKILYIFCSALILLMSGPQSFINGHMKICHCTFTFFDDRIN